MSNPQRDKGTRVEREIAHALTEAGIPTRRVIGSGAHGIHDERLKGDLQIGTHGAHGAEWLLTGEAKARKNSEGFKVLEGWLQDNDILLLKRNYRDPYAFMPWSTLVRLLRAYYASELSHLAGKEVASGDYIGSGSDVSCNEHPHGGEK